MTPGHHVPSSLTNMLANTMWGLCEHEQKSLHVCQSRSFICSPCFGCATQNKEWCQYNWFTDYHHSVTMYLKVILERTVFANNTKSDVNRIPLVDYKCNVAKRRLLCVSSPAAWIWFSSGNANWWHVLYIECTVTNLLWVKRVCRVCVTTGKVLL